MRAHLSSGMRLWLDIPVVVLLFAAGVYLWPSLSGKVAITLSGLFTLFLFAAFFVMPPLAFRREPKFRDDYALTFSSEGIRFKTMHIDSHLGWDIYSRALIDPNSYVLYYGSRSFTVIPKRVFDSTEQQGAFERLLTQYVPKIMRK
jgi:hypothetical protein